jgi:hypothetical protein
MYEKGLAIPANDHLDRFVTFFDTKIGATISDVIVDDQVYNESKKVSAGL